MLVQTLCSPLTGAPSTKRNRPKKSSNRDNKMVVTGSFMLVEILQKLILPSLPLVLIARTLLSADSGANEK